MSRSRSATITRALLEWYDRSGRSLPWRAARGDAPEPYHVWLSEVMLQQTTVAAVRAYYSRFLELWPDVAALAAAPREEVLKEWAGLGYYARARNLHDCARTIVEHHGGRFPTTEQGLRRLPGVGQYTAAAVAAIAFGAPATVVDGNVERVVARLFALETPLPGARPEIRRLVAELVSSERPGDFAQATMDFGATLCTPRSPACGICPLRPHCMAQQLGAPADYPRRSPKAARPVRFGAMSVIRRPDGATLVRTRPSSGLLGGMTEFFGTPWTESAANIESLRAACDLGFEPRGVVEHAFTHLTLRLHVYAGQSGGELAPEGYRWVSEAQLRSEPIPTLMRKVLQAATDISGEPRRNEPASEGTSAVDLGQGQRALPVFGLDPDSLGLVGLEGSDEQRRRQGEDHQA